MFVEEKYVEMEIIILRRHYITDVQFRRRIVFLFSVTKFYIGEGDRRVR